MRKIPRKKTASRLFVSYDHDEVQLALSAKTALEAEGHSAWVYKTDAKSGASTHKELAEEIDARDYFFCICTVGSDQSDGQEFERGIALRLKKTFIVVTFDFAHVSLELTQKNCHVVQRVKFEEECKRIACDLANGVELTISASETGEGEPVALVERVDITEEVVVVIKGPNQ